MQPQFDYNYNFNFPYILCYIDEFQDIYDGTDNIIRKTFCQLQYHDYMKTPNGRGYVIFKPVQEEKKIFYPSYLSSLPTLNISLRKPNGELLDKSEDGLTVFHIAPEQNYYLKIRTRKHSLLLNGGFCLNFLWQQESVDVVLKHIDNIKNIPQKSFKIRFITGKTPPCEIVTPCNILLISASLSTANKGIRQK